MNKVLLFLALAAINAWATPNLVSYQGKLDRDGSPFTGTASMEFALFETETGSTSFWNETQSVTVTDGIFNVLLGSITELPPLPTDGCWLEVTIDGDALPRQQITSVPYAEIAQQACANFKMVVNDTAMDYTCPADGVLLIGGGNQYAFWSFLVDGEYVLIRVPGGTIQPVPVTAGTHHISSRCSYPDFKDADYYLWAIFMR